VGAIHTPLAASGIGRGPKQALACADQQNHLGVGAAGNASPPVREVVRAAHGAFGR
jgi:hypothetical protein